MVSCFLNYIYLIHTKNAFISKNKKKRTRKKERETWQKVFWTLALLRGKQTNVAPYSESGHGRHHPDCICLLLHISLRTLYMLVKIYPLTCANILNKNVNPLTARLMDFFHHKWNTIYLPASTIIIYSIKISHESCQIIISKQT